MTSIKEKAVEYANSRSDDPSDEVIKVMEVAYLAGAKAMRDMAAEAASNRGDQHPTLHGAAACEAVAVIIRSLLPETDSE